MKKRTDERTTPELALTRSLPRATTTDTARYRERYARHLTAGFFRESALGLTTSSLGIGTYLGACADQVDAMYADAIATAIGSGINLVDTAINYRCQRSERAVGAALERAVAGGVVRREEVVICSKGGFIPLDGAPPPSREAYEAYVRREFVDTGIVSPDEIIAGGHSLAPIFLKYCIARSRQNLGVRTIDVYYLHNPEQQLVALSARELSARLRTAFETLEESVGRREIGCYGVASWNAFRVAPGVKGHLSLVELEQLARQVGGDAHHFRAIQLPINLAMTEALRAPTQPSSRGGEHLVTVLEAAASLGIAVLSSAPLMQGQLTRALPAEIRALFPHAPSDAARAVEFVRGLDTVTAALVGTKSAQHVRDLLTAVSAQSA